MDAKTLKIIGLGCFVVCAVLLFIAWERYNTNANNVQAMNQMSQGFSNMPGMSGMRGMTGQMKPAMPAAAKYALVFALLAAAGGAVCFVMAGKTPPSIPQANDSGPV